jgi:predicted nucleotidyltransferase
MNLNNIFSTKERIKVMRNIIYKRDAISVNSVARNLKISKGLVSKYFDILTKERILKKRKNKFLIVDNLYTRGLKILLVLNNFDLGLFKRYKFIRGAGIYGSCSKGTNTEGSDIDLWIKVKKTKEIELARLTNELKEIGNIKPLFLTDEKITLLKREDKVFYHSLVFGSINLYGEEIEI